MARSRVLFPALLAVLAGALTGCGEDVGQRVANNQPLVQITGGPLEGSTASYTARIYWSGWDGDGTIDHFEYALDPPAELTLDEVMAPEAAGLAVRLRIGPTERQDTLVVSKELEDGRTVSFRWVETTEFSQSFVFQTPHADSLFDPAKGQVVARPTFTGIHTVYLRAQDNEGLYSRYLPDTPGESVPPFRLGFNARTLTPSAEVTSPDIKRDLLSVGTTFTLRWSGVDPDSPDPERKPVGYFYKLLNTTELRLNCVTIADPNFLYFFTNAGDSGWTYQAADTSEHTFRLPNNKCFLLGVRAVDVAGSVEPFLQFGRNAFKFRTVPNAGWPKIILSEPSVGRFQYDYPGITAEGQAAVGPPLRFYWSATSEEYGGSIDGFSWGVDIADLGIEGPGSGWSGWGQITSTPPIKYARAGYHVLAVRARDTAGTINVAQLLIHFVPFPLDREALYVDDYLDQTYPRDDKHDAFWADLFDPVNSEGRFQPQDMVRYDVFGNNDTNTTPRVPTLEELGRYKLVAWSANGGGYNGTQALLRAAALTPTLAAYLRSGGHLWLTGIYTVAGTIPSGSGQGADLNYPKTALGAGDFAYDFLKIRSSRVANDKGVTTANTFSRAIPADSLLRTVPHIYNAMHVAWNKFSPLQTRGRGVSFVDAVFDPIFADGQPGFRGDLDSLYVYGSAGRLVFKQSSGYHARICALRWYDPDPAREHGRVQWFGFPMYYFKNAEAQDTFNKTIDWFRKEPAPESRP